MTKVNLFVLARDSDSRCDLSAQGWVLIDRCGKHFGTILNFLRDGSVPLPDNQRELEELLNEAKYYLIQDLIDVCETSLEKFKEFKVIGPVCSVPVSILSLGWKFVNRFLILAYSVQKRGESHSNVDQQASCETDHQSS